MCGHRMKTSRKLGGSTWYSSTIVSMGQTVRVKTFALSPEEKKSLPAMSSSRRLSQATTSPDVVEQRAKARLRAIMVLCLIISHNLLSVNI